MGDGGRGDAELLAGKHEALVPGRGLEEAQAFERGQVLHRESGRSLQTKRSYIISHPRAIGKKGRRGSAAQGIGRLGADVSISNLASGGRVANMSIATDESYIDRSHVS